jgi:cell division protein FtsL
MKLCSASSIFKSLYKVIIYTIVAVALGLLIVRYSMLDTSLKMDSKIKQKFNDLTNKYKELTKVARQALNGIKSTSKKVFNY